MTYQLISTYNGDRDALVRHDDHLYYYQFFFNGGTVTSTYTLADQAVAPDVILREFPLFSHLEKYMRELAK